MTKLETKLLFYLAINKFAFNILDFIWNHSLCSAMVVGHYSSGKDNPNESRLLGRADYLNQLFYKENSIPYKSVKGILIATNITEVWCFLGSVWVGYGLHY